MRDRRIWIAPTLCGCAISMLADWAAAQPELDDQGRAISHAFPAPFTATGLGIIAACDAHRPAVDADPAVDPWPGQRGYLRDEAAHAAYLAAGGDQGTAPLFRLPDPTPAEKLFTRFWGVTRRVCHLDTCHCEVVLYTDPLVDPAAEVVVRHPDSRHCTLHLDDDHQHTRALKENVARLTAWHHLLADPDLTHVMHWTEHPEHPDEKLWNHQGIGTAERVFKPGHRPRLHYDPERRLRAVLPAAAAPVHAAVAGRLAKAHPQVAVG